MYSHGYSFNSFQWPLRGFSVFQDGVRATLCSLFYIKGRFGVTACVFGIWQPTSSKMTVLAAQRDSDVVGSESWITTWSALCGLQGAWAETKQSSATRREFNISACVCLSFQQERIITPPFHPPVPTLWWHAAVSLSKWRANIRNKCRQTPCGVVAW